LDAAVKFGGSSRKLCRLLLELQFVVVVPLVFKLQNRFFSLLESLMDFESGDI
jgi:hypothetical protein